MDGVGDVVWIGGNVLKAWLVGAWIDLGCYIDTQLVQWYVAQGSLY